MTLIGVTKGVAAAQVQEAIACGLTDLGENRVQEARAKQQALGFKLQASGSSVQPVACSLQPVRWHLIGHLQRNKAKHAVEFFDVIHSIDSVELATALQHQALQRRTTVDVLIQVNVSGEATKFGCRPQDIPALAEMLSRSEMVSLSGLMTIAPFADDPEAARPYFRRLRELRDELTANLRFPLDRLKLSMGMSGDFEVAIEEGTDIVRIGTAIFGAREDETRHG